jgi:hypothetical protein
MVVLGGVAISYERGAPVCAETTSQDLERGRVCEDVIVNCEATDDGPDA